jgi:hypothetical protein
VTAVLRPVRQSGATSINLLLVDDPSPYNSAQLRRADNVPMTGFRPN